MGKSSAARRIKLEILKISRQKGSLDEIALGAAIGSFVGVFPTFGLGTPLVFLLYRFARFNLIVAVSSSLISNPFTSPFFMLASYKVGSFTTGTTIAFDSGNWTKNLRDLGWAMLLGSILISSLVSAIAFFATKYGLKFYRKNRVGHGKPSGFRPPQ